MLLDSTKKVLLTSAGFPEDAQLTLRTRQQPSLIISLFSSTSSNPTLLAHLAAADASNDSFVSLLDDATDGRETLLAWHGSSLADLEARSASLAALRRGLEEQSPRCLRGQVLHLQAPDCRTTCVRFGTLDKGKWRDDGLGVELPVVHFQLKELGQEMYLDVAVVDDKEEVTVVRCSTWQVRNSVRKLRSLPHADKGSVLSSALPARD